MQVQSVAVGAMKMIMKNNARPCDKYSHPSERLGKGALKLSHAQQEQAPCAMPFVRAACIQRPGESWLHSERRAPRPEPEAFWTAKIKDPN
jgi:hypothetical protein